MKRIIVQLLMLLLTCSLCMGATTDQLTRHGITWTFDGQYTYGEFANGDYWVVGPVTIISISPGSTEISGRTMNGSMINPSDQGMLQGYDSSMWGGGYYSASLNVALDVSSLDPLVVANGSSLISTISVTAANSRPQLTDAAVLTVLSTAPAAGSFRPPYYETDKTVLYNVSDLDYTKLPNLTAPASAPSLATVEGYMERLWLDHVGNYMGRNIHPSNNMPDYGRDMTLQTGSLMLSLLLDYTDSEKETALIHITQFGIDQYAIFADGGVWPNNGGHNMGRKLPILLAGLVLDDSDMLAVGQSLMRFHEDQQTWIVTQDDVGRPLYHDDGRPREEYIQADVGIAEWGEKHYSAPSRDGRNYNAYYRDINGMATLSQVLVANILGLRDEWNWEPLFLYFDRYVPWAESMGDSASTTFHMDMWDLYRDWYNASPISDAGSDQTVTDSDSNGIESVTLSGSGSSDSDGTIVSYVWEENSTQIATGVSPTVSLSVGVHTICLTVTDDDGATDIDTVTITVATGNAIPVADAGSDQTVTDTDDSGYESVTLDGSGSYDSDGSIVSYAWTENAVQIATGQSPSVTLSVGEHTITLTVTDDESATATDTVQITVDASPQSGMTFSWSMESDTPEIYPAGSDSTPTYSETGLRTTAESRSGSYSLDASGGYYLASFENNTNNQVWAATNEGAISLWWKYTGTFTGNRMLAMIDGKCNAVPELDTNEALTLACRDNTTQLRLIYGWIDGGGYHTTYITYTHYESWVEDQWYRVVFKWDTDTAPSLFLQVDDNAAVTGGSAIGSFTMEAFHHLLWGNDTANSGDGLYIDDVQVWNDYDMVSNVPPVADAGSDQSVTDTDLGGTETVTLDGSGSSDSDGSIVSYVWEENSTQIATGVSPTVSLSVGVHTIELTVTDDDSDTDTDTVVITVEAGNVQPVADAGSDQTVTDTDDSGYESVTLDGSGSEDSDGSIVSYVWEENSTQIATGASPTVSLSVGVHTIDLTVTDDDSDTDTDTVIITVEAPIVNPPSNSIAFDAASSSSAQAGTTLSWTHTIGSGSNRLLSVGLGVQDSIADDMDIVSVTYDGVAMTEAPGSRSLRGSGSKVQTASYYMLDADLPSSGSYTVSVTYAGTVDYMTGGAVSLDNVNQSAPEVTVATGDYSDTISSSITTLTDGAWVVDVVSIKAGWGQSWLPTGANMTERWDRCTGSLTSASATTPVASAGAVTLSWDYSDSASIIAHSLVAFAPIPVIPPVADAGSDQTVNDTDDSGYESVTLYGSGSSDSDGSIVSYVWEENSTQIATGVSPTVSLSVGVHTIDLIVTDDDNATDTDTVVITVEEAPDPIDFDASSSAGASAGTTLSWTHTIGSGSDRMLSVGLGIQDSSADDMDIVSVTYDGVSMTEAPDSRSLRGSGSKVQTAFYYMLDEDMPTSGSYTVSVTYAGTVDYMTGGAVSLENVNQSAPEATVATGSYGDTISSSITTLTDGAWVVDVVSIKAGWGQSWLPTGTGMIERWDQCTGSNTSASATTPVASAGAVTLSWDYSSSANIIAHSIIAFAPVQPVESAYDLLVGDANMDGEVNIYDFLILKSNYGIINDATWSMGDFTGDGMIDIYDFLALRSNYGSNSD